MINNAIEASASGQTVSIRIKGIRDSFTISIEDYGAGMDAETIENIFNPFFQGNIQVSDLGWLSQRRL